jgi:hypothetical protein
MSKSSSKRCKPGCKCRNLYFPSLLPELNSKIRQLDSDMELEIAELLREKRNSNTYYHNYYDELIEYTEYNFAHLKRAIFIGYAIDPDSIDKVCFREDGHDIVDEIPK